MTRPAFDAQKPAELPRWSRTHLSIGDAVRRLQAEIVEDDGVGPDARERYERRVREIGLLKAAEAQFGRLGVDW